MTAQATVAAGEDTALELLFEALHVCPQRLRARGVSMAGAIPDGAWVTLCLPRTIDLGDVIAVMTESTLLMHRVVGKRASGAFLLMGDRSQKPDGWFPASAARAKVTAYDVGEGPQPVLKRRVYR